jgi:hypothetical protein
MLILIFRSVLHLSTGRNKTLCAVRIPKFMVAAGVDALLSTLQKHVRRVTSKLQLEHVANAFATLECFS